MFRIYLAIVDVIPAAVVLVPLFGVLFVTVYHYNLHKCIWRCLFCLYLSAVFSLVGIPNVSYVRPEVNLNLIPFAGMIGDFKNSVLNVALFIPFGVFLPVLWHPYRKLRRSAFYGFVLSLAIELLQLLTFRATDVNDLITNVCGTLVGFLLARPFVRKAPAVDTIRFEPNVLCVLSFLIMFFFQPILSSLIWNTLL